ncbi:hypothetical protein [Hymenobacter swuensis]|uniref:Uncharacterized protein n=1 Tax=Hymenobacter swuensis DY53 TaxID=1227739 RepID=W8EUX5_9BACT|nr:hypothetical protein [Hymenobacter swuensis]AHJ95537.1 hypothetical protein Hsw_PA0204 [Hymenobacter swuensis DY53]
MLENASAQWPDSLLSSRQLNLLTGTVPAMPSIAYLRTDLYRLIAAEETDRPGNENSTAPLARYLQDWEAQRRDRKEDPMPWLRRLQEEQPLTTFEQALQRQQQYLAQLGQIRQRTQQLQARLAQVAAPTSQSSK